MAASLQEVANLAWLEVSPKASDDSAITREEFIATARHLYSQIIWTLARNEKNTEGVYNVPSYLLTEVEKTVVDKQMDISDLKILKALPSEIAIQNVGGVTSSCEYIKSNVNLTQLLNDDDSFDNVKTYYVIGDRIIFPQGTHKSTLSVLYANNGANIDGDIIIDDVAAGMLRDKLLDTYNLQRIGAEDTTNNSNSKT